MEARVPVKYPLIITLELEETHKSFFNHLRKTHFPAHANYLDAHVTLFHHLPSDQALIPEQLAFFAKREPMVLEVAGLTGIGNGVIYRIASEALQQLHAGMQEVWSPYLKRQDRQTLRPHITIQNKVTAFKASRLLEELQVGFNPFTITATGFSTWYYLGGPWRPVGFFPFNP